MDIKEAQTKLWNKVNTEIGVYRTTNEKCKIFIFKNEEIISKVVRENVNKFGLDKLCKLISDDKISGEILEKINKEGDVISQRTLSRMKTKSKNGFGHSIKNKKYKTTLDLLAIFLGHLGFDEYINYLNTENDFRNKDGEPELDVAARKIETYTNDIIAREEKLREYLQNNFPDAFWHVDYGRIADHKKIRLMDNIDTVAAKFTEFWNQYIIKKEKMNSERYKAWIIYDKNKYDNSIYIRKYIFNNLGLFFDAFFEGLGINKEELFEEKKYFDLIDQEMSEENFYKLEEEQSKEDIDEFTGIMLEKNMNLVSELEEKYPHALKCINRDNPVKEKDTELIENIDMVCLKITNFWVYFIHYKKRMDKAEYQAWIIFVKNLYNNSIHLRNYIKAHKDDFRSDFYSELGINKEDFL